MHSLAMAQDILQAALGEAAKHEAKKIRKIEVKIGDEHSDESDSIQFCLEAVAKGTIAEGATIEVEVISADRQCPECGFVLPLGIHRLVCPECGHKDLVKMHGDDSPQITLELD